MIKKRITIPELQEMKTTGKKFKMITVYDYPFAKIVDNSDLELILVGDSLGMVIQGHDGTIPVDIDDMLYHVRIVRRGAPNTFVVGDMPFLSYQVSKKEAPNMAQPVSNSKKSGLNSACMGTSLKTRPGIVARIARLREK